MTYIFETEGLNHTYKGNKTQALKDVNVKISKGKRTILMGANGAGKSTLFYHFNGVLKPSSGTVKFEGTPLDYGRDSLSELRSDVAVVLQNPDDQIFSSTVEEDIAFGMLNKGMEHDEIDVKIDEVLFMVGMEEHRMRPTQQLSYGQRKRIALAGAIATDPKVLILDEPTAGLDPQMSEEVMELTDQMHHTGTDVIISTHDVDLAYAWADEIHVMRHGSLIYSGSSEGFYGDSVNVSMSGLLPPAMYAINKSLSEVTGFPMEPCPRTRSELLNKEASTDIPMGKLYVVSANDGMDENILRKAVPEISEDMSVGLFGTDVRKYVSESEMKADYIFGGPELCLVEVLNGKDAIICCDVNSTGLLREKLDRVSTFGRKVNFEERISHE